MTNDEVLNLPGKDNPVLCADGKMAMLILYPGNGRHCGLQVHGEDAIRWLQAADLVASPGGALKQVGAPALPPRPADLVQAMLAMQWAELGPEFVLAPPETP